MTEEARLVTYTNTKRELQAKLKAVQEQIDAMEEAILLRWLADGIEAMKVETDAGVYLVYQSTRTFAKSEFVDLERLGNEFPGLLTVNHMKAGSLLAEYVATGNEGALAQLALSGITPNDVTRLNVRKG